MYQEGRKKRKILRKRKKEKRLKESRQHSTTYAEEARTRHKNVLRRNYRSYRSGRNTVFGDGRGYIRFSTDV
jgi:hypothetical protein